MKKWMMMMAGWLAVFGVGAQPPIAALHLGPSGNSDKWIDLIEESSAFFDLKGGLILVEASLNGTSGHFIIDTGAPGLVLNEKPASAGDWAGSGVTGCVAVEETVVERFTLGSARFNMVRAYKVDLSYLEESLQCNFLGLIGYEILREMEIILDYPNRRITLLPLRAAELDTGQRVGYLDFFLVNHIPVISAQLGKRDIYLGLDTGAGANVLRSALGKSYQDPARNKGKVRGTDQQVQISTSVHAPVVIDGLGQANAQDYLLMDLSHLFSDLDRPLDGLLGFPFLAGGKWSIHYGNERIYVWEE